MTGGRLLATPHPARAVLRTRMSAATDGRTNLRRVHIGKALVRARMFVMERKACQTQCRRERARRIVGQRKPGPDGSRRCNRDDKRRSLHHCPECNYHIRRRTTCSSRVVPVGARTLPKFFTVPFEFLCTALFQRHATKLKRTETGHDYRNERHDHVYTRRMGNPIVHVAQIRHAGNGSTHKGRPRSGSGIMHDFAA